MMTQVYFSINNAVIKVLFFVETCIMVEQNQNSRPQCSLHVMLIAVMNYHYFKLVNMLALDGTVS